MNDKPVRFYQRALSWLIISLLVWQPVAPAFAAAITPTNGAGMDKAANGVPVVNIATPNGAGISHNQFKDYNVGKEGLILNNATGQLTQTQLGGLIQNNPNLRVGQEAKGIINEVTGGSRSQLQGYTEVAGKAANVMVANPYGITCNGCGFINTPNTTLTTGKPQFDAAGNLAALEVTKGTITVEGQGLNASGSDALSLISRATEVNAAIHAKDLTVTTGANRVDASGKATAIAGEGAAPVVAVDTGALGGMYANRIRLVSTEKGVGVNLGNLTARQGDITLDANGKLMVKESLASGSLTAKGENVTLSGSHKAGGDIAVSAVQDVAISNATLAADGKLTLSGAGNTTLAGSSLTSGGDMALAGKQFTSDTTTQANAAGSSTLTAQTLNQQGSLIAGKDMTLAADNATLSGTQAAKGTLSVRAKNLRHSGKSAAGTVSLAAPESLSNSGTLVADTLNLSSTHITNSGLLQGTHALNLQTELLDNLSGGTLFSAQDLTLSIPTLSNSGLITTDGDLRLGGSTLVNAGEINGTNLFGDYHLVTNQNNARLLADGLLTLTADAISNDGLLAADVVGLSANTLVNSGTVQGSDSLALNSQTTDNHGTLAGGNTLTLSGQSLENSGLLAAKNLALNSTGITNSGTLQGTDLLTATGNMLANQQGGLLLSNGAVTLKNDRLDNGGQIQGDTLDLATGQWINTGTALGQNGLTATVNGTLDNQGKVASQQVMALQADSAQNSGTLMAKVLSLHGDLQNSGLIQGGDSLTLNGNTVNNQGQVLSEGVADITATRLANDGKLAAKDLHISAPDIVSNGILQGNDSLTLITQNLLNGSHGQLISGGGLNLNLDRLENQGLLYVQDGLTLTGNILVNGGSLEAGTLNATLGGTVDNSGTVLAQNNATLQADTLNNSGQIVGNTTALSGNALTNSGLIQGTQRAQATANSIINSADGRWFSGGALAFGGGNLSNAGQIQGDIVTLRGAMLDNQGSINGLHGLSGVYSGDITVNGQLTSGALTDLRADRITGSGRITGDTLALNANTLNNDGLWQGTHGLTLNADTLTTGTGSRTLSGGDFTLTAGQLATQGTLQGGDVSVTADDWTLGGTLLSQGDLTATVGNTLNVPGSLVSQGAMSVDAQTLNNDGQLLSAGDITLRGQQLTNNGTVQGNTLMAHEVGITNNGTLTGLAGVTLDNRRATTTLMARMAMATPQLELINAGSLLTQGSLDITAGAVNNAGIWQGNRILLAAQSLDNSGTISGSDGLSATLSGDITQQSGGSLASNGALNLNAVAFDNAGKVQGGDVTLAAATLTNRAGAQAVSAGSLTLTTPQLLNYGLLQGAGETRIDTTTQALNDGKLLSGGQLTLTTPQYSGAGWLQATNLILNAATNNGSGTLLAGQMTLTGDTFTNQGTTQADNLTLNYRQLTNNGTLLGNNQLTLNATQVDQSVNGKLFSGGDLFVGATGLNALGQVVALGNLTLQLANTFTGKTTLAAGKTLSVTSNGAIDNQSVMQGQAVNLSAGGQLTNSGQITTGSGASTLSGSSIVLNGNSAIQGGGDVMLASRGGITTNGFAGTLGNLTLSAPGAIINTALLYAANNLALYANSITNQRGDMLAGNNLWLQKDAAGNANSEVINTSGSIETRNGDITIKTGHLLNTRAGLNVTQTTTQNTTMAGLGNASLDVPYTMMPDGTWGYYSTESVIQVGSCNGHGACNYNHVTTYHYAPFKDYTTQKFALSQTNVSVVENGGAARISSARNLQLQAGNLENQASNILATGNIALSGSQLNNQSWQAGISYDYLVYQYGTSNNPTTATIDPAKSSLHPTVKDNNIPFQLVGHESAFTAGEIYRAVIQAGGNVSASFSSNISNTATTAHTGGVTGTITAPSLNTLSNQGIGGSVAKQALAAGPVTVNSPQWQDQLQNALQHINGGGVLDNGNASGTELANISGQQKGNASLGNAGNLANAGVTTAALKNTDTAPQQGKTVDTSAYPLPSGNNGYFVVSDNPKSPYLITVNPKLDGLGQLDPALFGDLNKLLGITPSAAPRETDSAYTDEKQFLGSSYMLDRIKLNPDYDYRFLGDAAFDTRYVSNALLNQTGSRYLNGIGSDLDQMRYLMDNAANAQQSLGLQFGVALTADQIAALDHSILWWESATINGETVMIPKLYLSPKDVTVNNGSVIAGNNVSLEGGNVTNSGSALLARNDLSVESSGQIINSNDALLKAGGNVDLSAIGDISNISSAISGKTVALESLDGSINNLTLADQYSLDVNSKRGSVSIKDTTLGSIASITAQDGLSLTAGKDITFTGATASAGGNLQMDAGSNIAVNAIQKNDAYSQSGFQYGYTRKTATSTADVSYQGSSITAGGALAMQADNNLTLSASDVSAGKDALLSAGHDLDLNAQQTSQNNRNGKSENHSTNVDRTTVSAGGNLTLTAGQDINSQAAGLAAEKQVGMQAGRDVNLLAEATTTGDSYKASKKTEINEQVRQQGTEIASGTGTVIIAGRDMNAEAAQVTAKGDIGVQAGRNVNLTTATESDYHYKEETKTKKGFLKKTTTHTISEQSATREAGTLLSGDNVTVKSGNDLLVKGSSVVGDGDVALSAAHNVDITAATNTDSNWQFKEKKKSGLMGSGGIGFTIGTSKTKQDLKEKGSTQSQSTSTVGSNGGDVTITAGNQLHIGGSDLIAKNDLSLTGDSVVVDPGHDKRTSDQTFEQKSSGLTVALSGAVGDVVNTAVSTAMEAKEQSDGRLAALQATKATLSGIQAGQASRLAEAANGSDMTKNGSFGVMASIGGQSSKSTSHSEQDTTIGSTLNAGNDLSVTATGKGNSVSSGDITVVGSQLKAGKDITFDAAHDIALVGAADTQKTTGSNSSKGGSIGVGIIAGPNGAGFMVSASMNSGKGGEKGNGTSWNETTLDAGQNVSLTSGRDTLLQGAQVNGNTVTADVGRNLTLSSLQDSNDYNSKQQSVSAGLSYTFGGGGAGASFSYSRDKMKSNYDSVQEQTGIYAGKGGFDVTVGNHTQLDGAVIASRADADKNRLDTGTLGFTDITNKADYNVEHQGAGFSTGGSVAGNVIGNMASTLLTGLGGSGHAEGTTQSAVAGGAIVIRDQANQQQDVNTLSRDTEHANGSIDPIFDKEKEQRRLQTAQLIGEIGNQVSDIVRTEGKITATKEAKASMAKATDEDRAAAIKQLEKDKKAVTENAIQDQMYQTFYNEAFSKTELGTGGNVQRAITAATAAVQALAGGDIKSALAGAAAPYIANEIANRIPETDPIGRVLAHAVVNAALAAATGKDAASAAAGAATGELAGIIALDAWGIKDVSQLSEEQKQTVSALATLASGLAGVLVGDSGANAVAAAQAGKTTVENNTLSPSKNDALNQALEDQRNSKNLLRASQDIVRLTNEDRASNDLLDNYRKGQLSDTDKMQLAGLLNQYGYELQSIYGYSEQRAAEAIQGLLNGGAFVASAADAKAYNEALSYLNMYGVQSGQAAVGTDILMVLPGVPGALVRGTVAAGGAYQTGIGIGQIADGNYGDGALNVGLGTAAIFGSMVGQGTISKPNGTIVTPGDTSIWQNSTIGNYFAKNEGVLSGRITQINPEMSKEQVRSLNRENESARILSQSGFSVEQNPYVSGNKNPDFKVNGEIFDNYAPISGSVRNIWTEVKGKIDEGQTANVVINMADTKVSYVQLQQQFTKWPVVGMDKLIIIDKSGNAVRIK